MKKHLEVVAAILIHEGKILCMKRGQAKYAYVSNKYEFPGGKIEQGETKHAALERELREEMAIKVAIQESDIFMTINYEYPDFSITLHTFKCYMEKPDFIMKEHIDFKWMEPSKITTLEWAPADWEIVERLSGEQESFYKKDRYLIKLISVL